MTEDRYQFLAAPQVDAGWLVCRRVRPDDTPVLYEAVTASMDHLTPWMPWAAAYTRERAEEFVDLNVPPANPAPVPEVCYLVCDRNGRLLGVCGLHARLGEHRLEIGYWVDVRATRRGVASVAAAALTDAAFEIPGLRAVEIHHDQANTASGAIPARLGFEHVATVDDEAESPGEVGVEWQWRMDRSAWPASAGARLLAGARLGVV